MDLATRIRRRQHSDDDSRLVRDYNAISPVTHLREPTGRGPVLERLLDYLDPMFENRLPENGYVWGPSGAGKSAVVSALCSRLDESGSLSGSVIHTSTRGGTGAIPDVVPIDARSATSDFGLYRAMLAAVLDESVPDHGVATEELHARLGEYLGEYENRVLVAIDHVGEPGTWSVGDLAVAFEEVGGSVAWIAVGRSPPSALSRRVRPPERIELAAYEELTLIDVLTARVSVGLAYRAIGHGQLQRIAEWANGNAHDALCALFVAAGIADDAGVSAIRERDLQAGMNAVPRPSVPLGQVLALPANRQRVLHRLVSLDSNGTSVNGTAEAIAGAPDIGLSATTVQRVLYELASNGIIERVRCERTEGAGRPPSRLEPRFPAAVFVELYGRYHA
jgi:Cdc6-like AAA superfamily ATPase